MLLGAGKSSLAPVPPSSNPPRVQKPMSVEELPDIVVGQRTSPVTLVEYSSINCPVCAEFHLNGMKKIKERFIDTGKLKLVYRHFPLDYTAVEAMTLVVKHSQEQWLPLLETAYKTQKDWIGRPPEVLGTLLGLTPQDCKLALADEKTKDLIVAKRFNAEQKIVINATPTFQILYSTAGQPKDLLINTGITASDLEKKLEECLQESSQGMGK